MHVWHSSFKRARAHRVVMLMDTITIGKDGTSTGFASSKSLADWKEKLPMHGDMTIDGGTGKLIITGNGKEKQPVKIAVQGSISCDGASCIINDRGFRPSIAFMETTKTALNVLSNYILAFDDFKIRPAAWSPMTVNNVHHVSIKPSGDHVTFNNDREMDIDMFLIDPSIVNKVSMKNDDIIASMNGATCGIASRGIGSEKSKIMICSKDAGKKNAHDLKTTLIINDEQATTARKIAFHGHSKRLQFGFDHGPRCYLIRGSMCCKYGNDAKDDDVECY